MGQIVNHSLFFYFSAHFLIFSVKCGTRGRTSSKCCFPQGFSFQSKQSAETWLHYPSVPTPGSPTSPPWRPPLGPQTESQTDPRISSQLVTPSNACHLAAPLSPDPQASAFCLTLNAPSSSLHFLGFLSIFSTSPWPGSTTVQATPGKALLRTCTHNVMTPSWCSVLSVCTTSQDPRLVTR